MAISLLAAVLNPRVTIEHGGISMRQAALRWNAPGCQRLRLRKPHSGPGYRCFQAFLGPSSLRESFNPTAESNVEAEGGRVASETRLRASRGVGWA